ncbi:MAG: Verru/Chthon cassette protein A, partial [Verrucomicrobiota bacterium]
DGITIPQFASVEGQDGLPPDHLWLDLFWMPTGAPTHVANPFTTHGKVNLNYRMVPFSHITRSTALHAAFKSTRLLALPEAAGTFEQTDGNWYHFIDSDETLKAFEARFDQGQVFRTESELCETFLIPEGQSWDPDGANMRAFWKEHPFSGDNTLERPYATLYSRVTTRSNSYRVHYHVQTLKKDPDSPVDTFDATRDTVLARRQGSALLQRELDPEHPDLPAYLDGAAESLPRMEQFYRIRVVNEEVLP